MRILLLLIMLVTVSARAQVAINTDGSDPDNSALLDVKSTSKGVLFPRMTTSEREAIATPATGLTVYDLTTQSYWYYNGIAWAILGNSPWSVTGNNIFNNNSGNVGIGTDTPNGKLHLVSTSHTNLNIQGSSTIGTWLTMGNTSAGGKWYNLISTGSANGEGPGKLLFISGSSAYSAENLVMAFGTSGNVGIATSAPNPSAALDVSSTSRGFLPPRMTTAQRNAISAPVEGLLVFNTDEKALNMFTGTEWSSLMPVPAFECGLNVTVNHLVSGGVAPVPKTVTYSTVNGIPGEPTKCWITQNLGADRQATAVSDATEASAGWYWQFNRKQGFKHDGATRTPNTTWVSPNNGNSDWVAANDPCALELGAGWRLPTESEWTNVENSGNWTNWNGPWNSALKLHAAGTLLPSNGSLGSRGSWGFYWSSSQFNAYDAMLLYIYSVDCLVGYTSKEFGFSARCVRDN